ncbi:MAG TPA: AMP-binding protein [Gammaproteobacteria bacterium]|nr:AMP-binding protein [Gammaproteobacteria bacterium]
MAREQFDPSGVERGPDGIKRYTGRPPSLTAMLRRSVDRAPDDEAIVEVGGERVSYRELWDRASRVAGGLRAAGLRPGDRAAIRLGNGLAWVLAFWGCQLAGVVAVPVNTRLTDGEADYVVTDSGASYVFRPGEPLPDAGPHAVENLARDDLAAIFYTSGTTGFPKGAMTTHGNFLANCETVRRVMRLPGSDTALRNLVSVPLFHVTGCNSQLLPTLELGGATVVMPQFEVGEFLRTTVEERISVLISVPAIYWLAISQPAFADTDVTSVTRVLYGGAPIAPELVRRIKRAFPGARVSNAFGLTETASVTTCLPHEYASEHADSVGFPAPVVDLDLFERDPRTGVGELLVRAPNVVAGYWNKPEATRDTFVDGWLHTGDLARIDGQGLVYVVDRVKDMINRGGENVYSVEVENVLATHPAVFEAAVVGVPDEVMGEKVGAVIVPMPGQSPSADDVVALCRQQLADFKVPQYVAVRRDPLPRNPGGKVLKPRVRDSVDWGDPLF